MLQPGYNPATGCVELDADATVNITMERTIPIGFPTCSDLSFPYDHTVSGVAKSDCEAYYREGRAEHTITLAAERTTGCRSSNSLMTFKNYSKPGDARMWENYVPSSIKVKLYDYISPVWLMS